jgi:HD-like signal output (HDOD) protein
MKAVNSSLYGLRGRVQTVQQAITYLGMREVAAITFEMGLRAAFPPAPELDPIWRRAALRGLAMGRIATQIGVDGWAAHSAGLFEECGKAVLFRHAPQRYRPLLQGGASDVDLLALERAAFGVSHEALGAALCETWGLAAPVITSVRHHVEVQAGADLPAGLQRPAVLALSAVAAAVLAGDDEALEATAQRVFPQVPLDVAPVLRAARRVQEKLHEAQVEER